MEPHHPYYPQKVTDKNVETEQNNIQIRDINDRVRGPSVRSQGLDKESEESSPPTENDIYFCREIYGEIVQYIDRQIASFFRHLQDERRWDDSMIVVMADHGEAFGEDGVFQHDWTANPIDPLVRVPLAVKYPSNERAGESYTHAVQTGDLFATLADVLGWDADRPPHTRPFTEVGDRPIVSKSNNAMRVTTDEGYAIRRGDAIVETVGDLSEEALSLLESSSYPSVASTTGTIPGIDEQERKELDDRLKHLGYK